MTDNILGVSALGSTGSVSNYSKLLENSSDGSNADFATILKNAIAGSIDNTQSLIDQSEQAEIDFALGNADNTNELGIAQEKAALAVSYTVALRDRFLDAYKEIIFLFFLSFFDIICVNVSYTNNLTMSVAKLPNYDAYGLLRILTLASV